MEKQKKLEDLNEFSLESFQIVYTNISMGPHKVQTEQLYRRLMISQGIKASKLSEPGE